MRKQTMTMAVCVFGLVQAVAGVAWAGEYYFHPSPVDLGDLDHNLYYTWGIQWNVPAGEFITQADLSIKNINDWQVEPNDILYIHLLDNPPVGVTTGLDYEGGGDAFLNQGILLTTYRDLAPGPSNPSENWHYDFTAAQVNKLKEYAANGVFGLGLDPDCHYYNDGVKLKITTVPEPTTALLGLMGAGLVLMKKRNRAVGAGAVA